MEKLASVLHEGPFADSVSVNPESQKATERTNTHCFPGIV
jgi:hypothetical protein